MSSAPIVDRIRIIPRPDDFLNRNVGASGEVFFNRATNSLRVYSGKDRAGFEIARADLANVDTSQFQINPNIATVTYTVTVENTGEGNKYVLNGEYWPELNFVVGYTYVFDQTDPTNVYYPNQTGGENNQHPLNFSADDINGELGEGTVYTDNVTYKLDNIEVTKQEYWDGFEAATQRSIQILVTSTTPSTLYYWCQNHANMGKAISVANPGTGTDTTQEVGASVDVSETVPESPTNGNLWLNTDTGKLYIYINDGDSEQWIQPAIQPVATNYNDLINRPSIPSSITDLSDVNASDPQVGEILKWDGSQWSAASDSTTGGTGTDADTLDGQDGNYYLNYANFTNTPTVFTGLTLDGLTTLHQTAEVLNTITNATGIVEHDFSQNAIWYHTNIADNFTANFTNLPIINSRVISLALILVQGSTARIPTAVQVDGVAQTINWQDGQQPTGNADSIDLVSFSLVRTGSLWTVLGSLSTYG